jgi:hypothetical protein
LHFDVLGLIFFLILIFVFYFSFFFFFLLNWLEYSSSICCLWTKKKRLQTCLRVARSVFAGGIWFVTIASTVSCGESCVGCGGELWK